LELTPWLRERAGGIAAAAEGLLDATRRLRARLEGRELAELAGDEAAVEMLLGGFDPESSEPYRPGSLARLYRDLYGLQVLAPRLLALRLRDGLPVSIAGRGVKVAWEKTRFLSLVEALSGAARRLLGQLGVEPPEPTRLDPFDPSWGLEAARRLAEEALRAVPPYSGEALAAFAASAPAPVGLVEALGAEPGELEKLGCRQAARVYGHEAPGLAGSSRLLCDPAGPLLAYRCLAAGAMRLLQLEELRRFIEAPDAAKALVEEALAEAPRERLEQLAQAAKGLGQRLPQPGGCSVEPPMLPMGVWSYRLPARIEDVEVQAEDGGQVGSYMDVLEVLAPLLYRGVAGIRPLGGEPLEVEIWFVAPQRG